jgi:hypothetical protein
LREVSNCHLSSFQIKHPSCHGDFTDSASSPGLEESCQAQQKNNGILKRVASLATGAADAVRSTFSPSKPRVKYPPAWELPPVSDAEVRRAFPSHSQSSVRDKSPSATCSGTVESSEEESDDSEHYMSGGLH